MSFGEIIQSFDVEEYLASYGKLRRSGPTNMVMTGCPICGDKRRDKFYINTSGGPGNGRWNSYCCHNQGNLVSLVRSVERYDTDVEAIDFIRKQVEGCEYDLIPIVEPGAIYSLPKPSIQLPGPAVKATPDHPCYFNGKLGTLADRGVTQMIIDRHQLYVTGGMAEYNSVPRPDLTYRLIIPIFNATGSELLSWQARDLSGTHSQKYLFPGGDASKDTFYDWFSMRGTTALLVEGVFHKWAWDSLGEHLNSDLLRHFSIATFGKKLSISQEAMLMDKADLQHVIIGWDMDAAPEIVRVAEKLNGRKKVSIMLPHASGRDPDELSLAERIEMLKSNITPYTRQLGVKMVSRLALLGRV